MNRIGFIKTLAALPLTAAGLQIGRFTQMTDALPNTEKMPVLFLGHGSPMNAIEENEFVAGFRKAGSLLPTPTAILCISAHWETRGTFVTAVEQPRTIHDFGGFPEALYQVQYPAPGHPELARQTSQLLMPDIVGMDESWGLDHGAWSVIKHLYPKANVPVVQLSLDRRLTPLAHYELARKLAPLRQKGILIVGSGNIVHNLGRVDWQRLNEVDYAYDWAAEARSVTNKLILDGDHHSLANYRSLGTALQLAIPTPEHFLPLLYCLAVQEKGEGAELFNDKALAGSLTMTSVRIDPC